MSVVTMENYARLGMTNFGKTQSLYCYDIYHKLIGRVMTGRGNFFPPHLMWPIRIQPDALSNIYGWPIREARISVIRRLIKILLGGGRRVPYGERIVFVKFPIFPKGKLFPKEVDCKIIDKILLFGYNYLQKVT